MVKGKAQPTARGLAALVAGEWANDVSTLSAGVLQVRKPTSGAISLYYRYTGLKRKQDRLPLGSTLTLAEARAEAAGLARRYQAGERDFALPFYRMMPRWRARRRWPRLQHRRAVQRRSAS